MSGLSAPPAGLLTGLESSSVSVKIAVGAVLSIALYNGLELTMLTFLIFRRYSGLYFWSMLLSNILGIVPNALVIQHIGYIIGVPGESIVLYSRLHLVFYNQKQLRWILWAIVISSITFVLPTSVTTFGSAFGRTPPWNAAYNVIERFQVTGFFVQETLLSLLYISETVKLLRLNPEGQNHRKRIMYELIGVNLIIIALDTALLTTEYLNFYYVQVSLKPMVYSIKLKLEFAVLGRLVALTRLSQSSTSGEESQNTPKQSL